MAPGKLAAAAPQGFTYVTVLFAMAIVGVGLAALGQAWSVASHREKEEELIQVGSAYARAIARYYASSPGYLKTYPPTMEDLVEDRRFVVIARHLRKIYGDPMSKGAMWRVVQAPDGGIMGVVSTSNELTLQRQPLVLDDVSVPAGSRYSDWMFVYRPAP